MNCEYVCVCACYVICAEKTPEGHTDDYKLHDVDPGARTSTDDTGEHAL